MHNQKFDLLNENNRNENQFGLCSVCSQNLVEIISSNWAKTKQVNTFYLSNYDKNKTHCLYRFHAHFMAMRIQ